VERERKPSVQTLRARAEALLSDTASASTPVLSDQDLRALIHDFAVHQVELEIQNEELQRSEQYLEAARDSYARLYNQSPVGYLTLNKDSIIKRANQTFIEMAGVSSLSELIDRPLSNFLEESDRTLFWGSYRSFFKNPSGKQLEIRLYPRLGTCFWVRLTGRMETDTAAAVKVGSLDGSLLVIVNNIDEQKRVAQALENKNTELEHFTYAVSHDLKSPLITIQSYAGMIQKDMRNGLYERAMGDLKRIENASAAMSALLNNLLELSRIGSAMSSPVTLNMNILIKDVLAQLAGPLSNRQITVRVQPDLPTLQGDRQRICEVVQNLIENAIKYMGDQASPCIDVGARNDETEQVFFVKDNGKGIDPDLQENIFTLFNKLDSTSEGTGIGLALVKRIIEMHAGRVWVESRGLGTGACFCFTVPE
jgi:light-regulated signal transduction histidine kinase (bacteriophytochrome)